MEEPEEVFGICDHCDTEASLNRYNKELLCDECLDDVMAWLDSPAYYE